MGDDSSDSGLGAVQDAVAAAARDAGRPVDSVALMAVSKTHGPDRIAPVLEAGHRLFGENRVQEAAGKWPPLRDAWPDIRLHLIGPLQTNKVRDALALFDAIQTVDRPKLAERLARDMDALGRHPDCFIQVNTGKEPQKAGIAPEDADAFIADCRTRLTLPVVGLMCIPPVDESPAPHFALLAKIAARHGLTELSMGMSADFREAIRFGATIVRVGTAIFGIRPPPNDR